MVEVVKKEAEVDGVDREDGRIVVDGRIAVGVLDGRRARLVDGMDECFWMELLTS